jgi:hypothetical protein
VANQFGPSVMGHGSLQMGIWSEGHTSFSCNLLLMVCGFRRSYAMLRLLPCLASATSEIIWPSYEPLDKIGYNLLLLYIVSKSLQLSCPGIYRDPSFKRL